MGQRLTKLVFLIFVYGLLVTLAGCSDNGLSPTGTAGPDRLPVSNLPATPSPVGSVSPATPVTPSPQFALLPTATPPASQSSLPEATPTRFPTVTPRQGQPIPDIGPSLTLFRTTRASFQTAYARAVAQMANVSGAARLVLAQSTLFSLDRTVWTFFFTIPQGSRSWAATYDSAGTKDKKELVTIVERAGALLPEDAGQVPISKILDSDEITTRLQQAGLPPELPIDTVYLQIVVATRQGRMPAYTFVNGSLNKQIIVNALNGQILQNDFI